MLPAETGSRVTDEILLSERRGKQTRRGTIAPTPPEKPEMVNRNPQVNIRKENPDGAHN